MDSLPSPSFLYCGEQVLPRPGKKNGAAAAANPLLDSWLDQPWDCQQSVRATFDHHLITDKRILHSMLRQEHRYMPPSFQDGESSSTVNNQNSTNQIPSSSVSSSTNGNGHHQPKSNSSSSSTRIPRYTRKVLTSWMLEVCEELQCEEVVSPLAINFLDRFLGRTSSISKSQLQLLGAVCLLIASKLRQTRSIHPENLRYYSDYSLSCEDILDWELMVLTKLKWDTAAIVATDYFDHLMSHLSFGVDGRSKVFAQIRRHASIFSALMLTDCEYARTTPSMVASIALAAAVDGLNWSEKPWVTLDDFITSLNDIIEIDPEPIKKGVSHIEILLTEGVESFAPKTTQEFSQSHYESSYESESLLSAELAAKSSCTYSPCSSTSSASSSSPICSSLTGKCNGNASKTCSDCQNASQSHSQRWSTPTDVLDIYF